MNERPEPEEEVEKSLDLSLTGSHRFFPKKRDLLPEDTAAACLRTETDSIIDGCCPSGRAHGRGWHRQHSTRQSLMIPQTLKASAHLTQTGGNGSFLL